MAKVLGIGNALVDILTRLESDDTLQKYDLPKGSMQLVDGEFSDKVNQGTIHLKKEIASGGSAANTIHGLAKMGIQTGFIGKVGRDDFGDLFKADMIQNGIEPLLLESDTSTGKAMALISMDSERTFATYLGAAIEVSAADLSADLYKGYNILHIEGYLVQNHALIEAAVMLAKENGLRVSLDLASYNVVEDNLEFLQMIVKDYVDIVFANEEEARAFTGKEPEEAIHLIGDLCDYAIVKVGKEGSMIKHKGEVTVVDSIVAKSIDTTGAGDLYASGFLCGLMNGYPIKKCGQLGSILAGKTIEVIGPKMTPEKWDEVKQMIAAL